MEGGPWPHEAEQTHQQDLPPWHLCLQLSAELGRGARRSGGRVCLSGPSCVNCRKESGEEKRCFSSSPGSCSASPSEPEATAGHVWGKSALVHLQRRSST